MALTKDPFDVFGREAPASEPAPASPSRGVELRLSRLRQQLGGLEEGRVALDETAKSLRRTHHTLPRTRPLTGHADTDRAVASTLIAFPRALDRIGARLGMVGTIVDTCVSRFERADAIVEEEVRQCGERLEQPMSRTATPTEAVAGGIAALQRLGMRARLYSEELLRAQVQLEFGQRLRRECERLRPLGALLREFGTQCDTLSFHLQPAREQLEEALAGLDTIGVGRGAISHFTSGPGGGVNAVYGAPAAVEAFLAEHPEHSVALTTYVRRATEAYAHAEASRDQLAAGLEVILDAVEAL